MKMLQESAKKYVRTNSFSFLHHILSIHKLLLPVLWLKSGSFNIFIAIERYSVKRRDSLGPASA